MQPEARPLLTDSDRAVIRNVLFEHADHELAPFLARELARARIVRDDEIPDNVVTLHSRAWVVEEYSGRRADVIVVPPALAHPKCGHLSVLEPVGAAVIGLAEGQALEWKGRTGLRKRFKVVSVEFQPEAENRRCVSS